MAGCARLCLQQMSGGLNFRAATDNSKSRNKHRRREGVNTFEKVVLFRLSLIAPKCEMFNACAVIAKICDTL